MRKDNDYPAFYKTVWTRVDDKSRKLPPVLCGIGYAWLIA